MYVPSPPCNTIEPKLSARWSEPYSLHRQQFNSDRTCCPQFFQYLVAAKQIIQVSHKMVRKFKKNSLIAALLFVANCVMLPPEQQMFSENLKTGATTSQMQRDETQCQAFAVRQVPASVYTTAPMIWRSPTTTSCIGNASVYGNLVSGTSSCTSQGGPVVIPGTTRDANSDLRERVYFQCLTDRGYRLITQRGCALTEVANFNAKVPNPDAYRTPRDYNRACFLNVLGRLNLYIPR